MGYFFQGKLNFNHKLNTPFPPHWIFLKSFPFYHHQTYGLRNLDGIKLKLWNTALSSHFKVLKNGNNEGLSPFYYISRAWRKGMSAALCQHQAFFTEVHKAQHCPSGHTAPRLCSVRHRYDIPQPPVAPLLPGPWLCGPRQAGQGRMPGMKGSHSFTLAAIGTEILVAKASHSLQGLFGSSGPGGMWCRLRDVGSWNRRKDFPQGYRDPCTHVHYCK